MSGSGAEADTEGQGSQMDIGKKEGKTKTAQPLAEGESEAQTPETLMVGGRSVFSMFLRTAWYITNVSTSG
mgnify:FL=1